MFQKLFSVTLAVTLGSTTAFAQVAARPHEARPAAKESVGREKESAAEAARRGARAANENIDRATEAVYGEKAKGVDVIEAGRAARAAGRVLEPVRIEGVTGVEKLTTGAAGAKAARDFDALARGRAAVANENVRTGEVMGFREGKGPGPGVRETSEFKFEEAGQRELVREQLGTEALDLVDSAPAGKIQRHVAEIAVKVAKRNSPKNKEGNPLPVELARDLVLVAEKGAEKIQEEAVGEAEKVCALAAEATNTVVTSHRYAIENTPDSKDRSAKSRSATRMKYAENYVKALRERLFKDLPGEEGMEKAAETGCHTGSDCGGTGPGVTADICKLAERMGIRLKAI